jgi:hypothetical protein
VSSVSANIRPWSSGQPIKRRFERLLCGHLGWKRPSEGHTGKSIPLPSLPLTVSSPVERKWKSYGT